MRSFRTAILTFLAGFMLSGPTIAGPYDDGMSAFAKGKNDAAIEILLPLAEEGDVRAQTAVGHIYLKRARYNDDLREAHKWLHLAAEQGAASAQVLLGYMYTLPLYEDNSEAIKWYRLAAGQGHVQAQFALGNILNMTPGPPQNREEAVQWYQMAANQGYVDAYLELSRHYRTGKGVPKDLAEAVRWTRLAAEQGNVRAYLYLAGMYEKGEGVPQDNVQTYMWYDVAQLRGDESAARYRDKAARRMTQEQIAEAQRLVREWMAGHHQ